MRRPSALIVGSRSSTTGMSGCDASTLTHVDVAAELRREERHDRGERERGAAGAHDRDRGAPRRQARGRLRGESAAERRHEQEQRRGEDAERRERRHHVAEERAGVDRGEAGAALHEHDRGEPPADEECAGERPAAEGDRAADRGQLEQADAEELAAEVALDPVQLAEAPVDVPLHRREDAVDPGGHLELAPLEQRQAPDAAGLPDREHEQRDPERGHGRPERPPAACDGERQRERGEGQRDRGLHRDGEPCADARPPRPPRRRRARAPAPSAGRRRAARPSRRGRTWPRAPAPAAGTARRTSRGSPARTAGRRATAARPTASRP